jgi:hypothetical protein
VSLRKAVSANPASAQGIAKPSYREILEVAAGNSVQQNQKTTLRKVATSKICFAFQQRENASPCACGD